MDRPGFLAEINGPGWKVNGLGHEVDSVHMGQVVLKWTGCAYARVWLICCVDLLQTPVKHADYSLLEQAVSAVEEVIAEVDTQTGLSKCQFAISRLDYVDDRQVICCRGRCLFVLMALCAWHYDWVVYQCQFSSPKWAIVYLVGCKTTHSSLISVYSQYCSIVEYCTNLELMLVAQHEWHQACKYLLQ